MNLLRYEPDIEATADCPGGSWHVVADRSRWLVLDWPTRLKCALLAIVAAGAWDLSGHPWNLGMEGGGSPLQSAAMEIDRT